MSSVFGGASGIPVPGEITCGEPEAKPAVDCVPLTDAVGEVATIIVVGMYMVVSLLVLMATILVGGLVVGVSVGFGVSVVIITVGTAVLVAELVMM